MNESRRAPVQFDADETAVTTALLTTTRAVRRRLDHTMPLDLDAVRQALTIAGQAPSAGNRQPLRWIAVTDPDVRAEVSQHYRDAYLDFDRRRTPAVDDHTRALRSSSAELADRMHLMPLILLACSTSPHPVAHDGPTPDPAVAAHWASVLPGVWSLQLALRSRGIGSCLTTVGLSRAEAIMASVSAPPEWELCALLPVAPMNGATLSPAHRLPLQETTRWI